MKKRFLSVSQFIYFFVALSDIQLLFFHFSLSGLCFALINLRKIIIQSVFSAKLISFHFPALFRTFLSDSLFSRVFRRYFSYNKIFFCLIFSFSIFPRFLHKNRDFQLLKICWFCCSLLLPVFHFSASQPRK